MSFYDSKGNTGRLRLSIRRRWFSSIALGVPIVVALSIAFHFMGSHVALADISTGLLGHWTFNEGSGTTVADSSGNSNNGTIVSTGASPTWVTGIDQGALQFDGTGAFAGAANTVRISNSASLDALSAHTLSLWAKFDAGYMNSGCTWANLIGRTQGADFSYMVYVNKNGRLRAHIQQSNGAIRLFDSAATIQTGQWVNIMQVADGSNLRLYINGVEDAASPLTYNGTAKSLPSANMYIGQDTRECAPKATIDDARIYSRALDPDDIGVISNQFYPVAITTVSLPDGTTSVAYSKTLAATGGTPPYTWSIVNGSGTLPNGLTLNSTTGEIGGTPTQLGTFTFTVRATDTEGESAEKPFTIRILSPAILTDTLPDGTVSGAYLQTLQGGGGTPPYIWSIASGALPDGLTLNPTTGAISGTPTTAGSFTFTVQLADSASGTTTRPFTIVVHAAPQITTTSLDDGEVNKAYSEAITAIDGTKPYSWSVIGGSLPPGLTLDTAGVLTGTPTAQGDFSFTVQVQDANNVTDTQNLSIHINPVNDSDDDSIPDAIENAAPNGGDANNDGTPDRTQGYVASFENPVTNTYATLIIDNTCFITEVSVVAETVNVAADDRYEYPNGLIDFVADCGTPGFTATINQYYFGVEGTFVVRKYNPNTQAYSTIEGASVEAMTIGGLGLAKATYQITDGGPLDLDGSPVNGILDDPAGLAVPLAINPTDPGSSNGATDGLASTGQSVWHYVLFVVGLIAGGVGLRQARRLI